MIAVIGCGNPNRSDDGAGAGVLHLLKARGVGAGREDIRLLDAGTDGMSVMFAARGCRALIIIDAARSGSTPGDLFEVPGAELEQSHKPTLTLHDFRWDHALFAGRKIYGQDFPADVTVLLIEAASLDFGIGLSAPVSAAVERAADRVELLLAERQGRREAAS
ncbi:hydrogenase maturation protease [Oleomonas cavernae]|uniref:Hydrogenase maturation protease n=1 Tax=Oleomonas cavernae TaxID=2320859 RepID=A0A418W8R2_9PROT|nr:hydrogenase maturation protease [Oleomonas cavernae]RJF86392.1 hydrogenase maturation protease [Oleomonas cavernae]